MALKHLCGTAGAREEHWYQRTLCRLGVLHPSELSQSHQRSQWLMSLQSSGLVPQALVSFAHHPPTHTGPTYTYAHSHTPYTHTTHTYQNNTSKNCSCKNYQNKNSFLLAQSVLDAHTFYLPALTEATCPTLAAGRIPRPRFSDPLSLTLSFSTGTALCTEWSHKCHESFKKESCLDSEAWGH